MNSRSSDKTLPKSPVPNRIKSLFHCFDGEPLYSAKKLEKLHSDPCVYFLKDFLNPGEIDYFDRICTHYSGQFRASFTEDDQNSEVISEERTSNYLHLTKSQDSIIRRIEQRAADLVGLNPTCVEPIQIVRYTDGQKFEVHHDAGTLNADGTISLVNPRRLVTLFVYLNDLPEGQGHTEFPALKMSVKPTRGCGVMFSNVLPNGECDARAIHQANSVSRGLYKYGLNIWLCDRDLQDLAQVVPSIQALKMPPVAADRSVLTLAQRLTEGYSFDRPPRSNSKSSAKAQKTPTSASRYALSSSGSKSNKNPTASADDSGSTTHCSSSSSDDFCYWNESDLQPEKESSPTVAPTKQKTIRASAPSKTSKAITPKKNSKPQKATELVATIGTAATTTEEMGGWVTPTPTKRAKKESKAGLKGSTTPTGAISVRSKAPTAVTPSLTAPVISASTVASTEGQLDDWRVHYASLFDYHEDDFAENSSAANSANSSSSNSPGVQRDDFALDLLTEDLPKGSEASDVHIVSMGEYLDQENGMVGMDNSDSLSVDFEQSVGAIHSANVVDAMSSGSNIAFPPIGSHNIVVNYMLLPDTRVNPFIPEIAKVNGVTAKISPYCGAIPVLSDSYDIQSGTCVPGIHEKRKRKTLSRPPLASMNPTTDCTSVVTVSVTSDNTDAMEDCTLDSPIHSSIYSLPDELGFDVPSQGLACCVVEPSPLLCCTEPLNEFEIEVLNDLMLLDPSQDDDSGVGLGVTENVVVVPAVAVGEVTDDTNHWCSEVDAVDGISVYWQEGRTAASQMNAVDVNVQSSAKKEEEVPVTQDTAVVSAECEKAFVVDAPLPAAVVADAANHDPSHESGMVEPIEAAVAANCPEEVEAVARIKVPIIRSDTSRNRSFSSSSDDSSLCDSDIYDMEELQRHMDRLRKPDGVRSTGVDEDDLYWY